MSAAAVLMSLSEIQEHGVVIVVASHDRVATVLSALIEPSIHNITNWIIHGSPLSPTDPTSRHALDIQGYPQQHQPIVSGTANGRADSRWWLDNGLRWNVLWVAVTATFQVTSGYDSFLLNSLQAVPKVSQLGCYRH